MTHSVDEPSARPETAPASRWKTALITLLIVLVGAGLIWLTFKTEPSARRGDAARDTAMLVDVKTAEKGSFRPTIEVLGQVVPAQEVILRPRVGGQVIEQADAFTPGGHASQGETLLRIDPADYQAVLRERQSDLQQAQADLALEQGRQTVAQQEFELLGDDIPQGNEALMLREPQREQARARVLAAEAALERAQLDLERTRIKAPFNAQVQSREVTLGSQVNAGDTLARLVATDRYWVEATVPLSKLRWLHFGDESDSETLGAPVTLRHDNFWPEGASRAARLSRLVGELDNDTRMARVIVTVDDPLALAPENSDAPRLILDAFVNASIQGRRLDDVVRLERELIRRDNTVWVMEEDKLSIRDVTIAFQDAHYAYVESGVEAGEQVVVSDLVSVVEGAALRLEGDEP
ncbi:efflux RND transporter periplasmic adaptor subunit [Halomonas alkaliantarctica]|nr:efflux RND transporter periplasmic adaptor subunit [Halomonas alkaliantarctica]